MLIEKWPQIALYAEQQHQIHSENLLLYLSSLKLHDLLNSVNPYYLYQVENLSSAGTLVDRLIKARLSPLKERMFEEFLRNFSLLICDLSFYGKRSLNPGIDIEFERDKVRYIVRVCLNSDWESKFQVDEMIKNFIDAKRALEDSNSSTTVVAVNGCVYGRDEQPNKGLYLKLCGQRFWELISGNELLYVQIVELLAGLDKGVGEEFQDAYAGLLNRLTFEFMQNFCDPDGQIIWERIVQLNSGKKDTSRE
jgi:hypothetical protein